MPLQIPARGIPLAGKQRVDAGLRLGRIEDEFGLAAFLRYRVVTADRDLSVGLAIRSDPVAEHSKVDRVCQSRQAHCRREPNHDHSQQPTFEFGARHSGHRRAIIPAPGVPHFSRSLREVGLLTCAHDDPKPSQCSSVIDMTLHRGQDRGPGAVSPQFPSVEGEKFGAALAEGW
jgi:hypothetical protein